MNLSGWQRIGIVISVLWVLLVCGVATYDYKVKQGLDGGFGFAELVTAKDSTPLSSITPNTNEPHSAGELKTVLNISRVLTISLVPVFSAWFLFYVAIFVGRWVRNGFRG